MISAHNLYVKRKSWKHTPTNVLGTLWQYFATIYIMAYGAKLDINCSLLDDDSALLTCLAPSSCFCPLSCFCILLPRFPYSLPYQLIFIVVLVLLLFFALFPHAKIFLNNKSTIITTTGYRIHINNISVFKMYFRLELT